MSRRSIVFTGHNELSVIEESLPEPGEGQVLVQTTRSLISTGTELICLGRNFSPGTHWDAWVKYPFRTGYLNAGKIIAVGAAVTSVKVGDRVASRGYHS